MDPLSALGLAGLVVQFVQLAASLVKGSQKIYRSPTEQSEELQDLKTIYTKLSELSDKLGKSHGVYVEEDEHETDQAGTLNQLADMCRRDCEQLLDIVDKLNNMGKGRSKAWKSFVKAMGEVWKSSDIAKLQERIAGSERAMIVHMCATSR